MNAITGSPDAETPLPKREPNLQDGGNELAAPVNNKARVSAAPKRNGPLRKILVLAGIVIAGAVGGGYYLRFIAPYESTDDAFIEGRVTSIAPQVAGRVVRLCVQDNQQVKRGDILVEIDPSDYQARLSQAEANLAAARSQLEQAKAQLSVDQAKAEQEQGNISVAEAEANRAQAELKRYQSVESRAVSRSQVDVAETQARSTAAQADVARNRARAAGASVKLSEASILTAAAGIQQSEAAVEQARLTLSYTKVFAPEDGHVTRRNVEQGSYLQPGQPIMAIVPRQVWVVANFKETQLTTMRPGQPVEILVDAYPGHPFHGSVDSIQRGAGARFSLFPPENATGNYVKVVQRVPVKIVFDYIPDSNLVLGPGMSVEPKVKVK